MSESVDTGGKGGLSSVLLVAAVSGVLLTGFLLKSEAPGAAARSSAPAPHPSPAPALGSTIEPELQAAASVPPAEPEPEPAPSTPKPHVEAPSTAAKPVESVLPAPAGDPVIVKLAARAERDHGRLAKAAGRWTAQLIVACRPDTVDRLIAASGSSQKLYVLPAQVKDEACFRVCFGAYGTPKEAAAAADLPKALRGKEKIGAVEIAKVLL
jgi:septal ring-binding cell division protein DamX